MRLVNELGAMVAARKGGCTAAQLTLAWVMKQEGGVFPIPGTKKVGLSRGEPRGGRGLCCAYGPGDEKEIREAVEKAEVHGTRYAEHLMGGLVQDTPLRSSGSSSS